MFVGILAAFLSLNMLIIFSISFSVFEILSLSFGYFHIISLSHWTTEVTESWYNEFTVIDNHVIKFKTI